MRDLAVLFLRLLATVARLAGPDGVRSVVAESVLVKHQQLILNRSRKRSPTPLRAATMRSAARPAEVVDAAHSRSEHRRLLARCRIVRNTALPSMHVETRDGGQEIVVDGYDGPLPVTARVGDQRINLIVSGRLKIPGASASVKVALDPDGVNLVNQRR